MRNPNITHSKHFTGLLLICLWIAGIFCCKVSAQPSVEGLRQALVRLPDDTVKVRVLVSLSKALRESEIKQAATYAHDAFEIAKRLNDTYWKIQSLIQLGWSLGMQGKFAEALSHLGMASELTEKQDDKEAIWPSIYLAKGRVQYEKQFLPEAYQEYLKALRGFEDIGDSLGVAEACGHMGAWHFFSGEYKPSLAYLTRAERILRNANDEPMLAQVLSNLCNSYALLGESELSDKAVREAIAIQSRYKNYGGLAKAYTNLAMNFYEVKRYDSALHFFSAAYVNDSLWKNPVGVLYSQINMAAAYRKLGKPEQALNLAFHALESAKTIDDLHLQRTILEDIAEIYEDLGQPSVSLKYYKQFLAVKDSILNSEKARLVADMQARYEVDKKERTLEVLRAEKSRNLVLMYSFLGLAILLGAIGLMQYRLHKQKIAQAAQQLAFQQQELGTVAGSMIQKDELIAEITSELESLRDNQTQQRIDNLTELLQARLSTQDDWTQFQVQFEKVYPGFFQKLQNRFPNLTPTEIKLCAFEKLGLKDTQAGDMLGVNPESIRKGRYRLRKGVGETGWEELKDFLISI
ncbi:MAG: tetratricopeptide repeat protein [Chitinophagaceae bacterium]|nr:tetratricopeptide repeat protein [Chitinophagaceae bacterium]